MQFARQEAGARRGATSLRQGFRPGLDARLVSQLAELTLFADDEPDAAHVTFLLLTDGWRMLFDFRYNAAKIRKHLQLADEYIDTATNALGARRLQAFAENAYAATELCVRAELISSPDEALMKSKNHRVYASRFHYHARLGNTDPRFARLLKNLENLRSDARYAENELSLDAATAAEMLAELRELRAWVESRRPLRAQPDSLDAKT